MDQKEFVKICEKKGYTKSFVESSINDAAELKNSLGIKDKKSADKIMEFALETCLLTHDLGDNESFPA